MSTETTQIPFVPIKPRKDLEHPQVGTWTLKYKRQNQTTDKLISSSLDFIDSVELEVITCQKFVLFW